MSREGRRLPVALENEIENLHRFGVRHTAVADQVILAVEVRGVPVVVYLDLDTYPAQPPRLEIAREWLGRSSGRLVRGLEGQEQWNRTLGIGTLLRELERRFIEDPPKARSKDGGGLMRTLRSKVEWLKNLVRRLFGGREAAAAAAMPTAIRARYEEIIGEKAFARRTVQRGGGAVMTQWQHKTADLERMGREIQALERGEETKLAEAERLVDKLKAAGNTLEQIKDDALYQRCLSAYEDLSEDLAEKQERFTELEEDAEEHLAKIRDHEARLEALVRELEEFEDEFAEVAADLTTVQLEQEIADLRAGISRAGSDEELRQLLRQFRKAKAAVRITREAADLDRDAQDAEYLEVARKVAAARRFETSVGLGEAVSRAEERLLE